MTDCLAKMLYFAIQGKELAFFLLTSLACILLVPMSVNYYVTA